MGAKLSCSATSCVHNMNNLCTANRINITGVAAHSTSGTECESYSAKGFINAVANIGNMNIAGEIKQVFKKDSLEMSPSINCNATNCLHNVNKACNATNVSIYGADASVSEATQCETFAER